MARNVGATTSDGLLEKCGKSLEMIANGYMSMLVMYHGDEEVTNDALEAAYALIGEINDHLQK